VFAVWDGLSLCTYMLGSLLGLLAKLRKVTINFVMSVRLYGTTRLPLDRFSLNLIFEDFQKSIERKLKFH
jgi:hypothetical protein